MWIWGQTVAIRWWNLYGCQTLRRKKRSRPNIQYIYTRTIAVVKCAPCCDFTSINRLKDRTIQYHAKRNTPITQTFITKITELATLKFDFKLTDRPTSTASWTRSPALIRERERKPRQAAAKMNHQARMRGTCYKGFHRLRTALGSQALSSSEIRPCCVSSGLEDNIDIYYAAVVTPRNRESQPTTNQRASKVQPPEMIARGCRKMHTA
jgi:hypothetical protein